MSRTVHCVCLVSVGTRGEALLTLETRAELAETLSRRVVALHRYDCPSAVVLEVIGGHADDLAWIEGETRLPAQA